MISLPYPPSTNRYWKNFRGRMVVSKEATIYKRVAAMQAKRAGVDPQDPESGYPITGPVELVINLHPKLAGGKMKDGIRQGGRASETRMDLDNVLKIAIDSMNGIAYADDKQVRRLSAEIGHPVEGGGLSIWIAPYSGSTRSFTPITGETA